MPGEADKPVPNALVEIYQANAGGRYRQQKDTYLAPADPNFVDCGRTIARLANGRPLRPYYSQPGRLRHFREQFRRAGAGPNTKGERIRIEGRVLDGTACGTPSLKPSKPRQRLSAI